MTMRAVLVKDGKGPIEHLHIGETPIPTLKTGEVLVKVKAFGLNRMDVIQRQGNYPLPPGASEILGVEFSGTVAKLGEGATKWKEGDEVFGLVAGGAYAEYVSAPQTHLIPKPEYLTWVEAASIPEAFLTAYQALVLVCDLKKDENVLIHAGASGVGVAANQIARFFGAKAIVTTASTEDKLSWLRTLGATHTANYKTTDFSQVVKDATNGRGVDVVVDFVGKTHWEKNVNSLALDGRMVILAALSGAVIPELNILPLLYKRLRIQGSTLRSRSVAYQTDLIARFSNDLLGHITGEKGDGAIKSYVHKVYPWTEIQTATREMEAGANSGKIMVEIV
ncbi:quinone oxidoreductase putative [Exidia glandulosa HHB12029]|uniref:Quinone oxidoreductase putative n=1 Tax=Exidia glandulosa HHB12029 TaxID=1314781 RepID=A0A165DZQ2_EXIGL|nr:quinone oxidoreductase putative [Exidia glandulosa HHB12029]